MRKNVEISRIVKNMFFLLLVYLVYIVIFAPAYTSVCNDIMYINTYLPDIFELLMEAASLTAWGIICATIIYISYSTPSKKAFLYMIVSIIVLLRYILSVILSFIIDGFPTSLSIGLGDIGESLILYLFDMVQILTIALISHVLLERCRQKYALAKKSAYTLGDISLVNEHNPLPIKKLFGLKNAIQRTSLFSAFIISAVRVAMRIRYDIFYGAPESMEDVMWMIIYYSSDIIFGVLVYFFTIGLINRFYKKDSHTSTNL